jgi:hypothetical protein
MTTDPADIVRVALMQYVPIEEDEADDALDALDQLVDAAHWLSQERERLREKLKYKNWNYEDTIYENEKLAAKNEQLQSERDEAMETAKHEYDRAQRYLAENERLRSDIEDPNKMVSVKRGSITAYQTAIANLQRELSDAKATLSSAIASRDDVEYHRKNAMNRAIDAETENERLREALRGCGVTDQEPKEPKVCPTCTSTDRAKLQGLCKFKGFRDDWHTQDRIERLREALRQIISLDHHKNDGDCWRIAREALSKEDKNEDCKTDRCDVRGCSASHGCRKQRASADRRKARERFQRRRQS